MDAKPDSKAAELNRRMVETHGKRVVIKPKPMRFKLEDYFRFDNRNTWA